VPEVTSYASLTSPQDDDILMIVDVHDTSMSGEGTTKQITVGNLGAGGGGSIPDAVPITAYEVSSVYPTRASVTSDTSRPVIWVGPDAPTIGGSYAINGLDLWIPTTV
jgi:hypothetical protein